MGKRRMFRAKGCIVHVRAVPISLAIIRNRPAPRTCNCPYVQDFARLPAKVSRLSSSSHFWRLILQGWLEEFLAHQLHHSRWTGEEVKMRLLARVAVILILLGCGTAPMLYGKMAAAAGTGQSVSGPKFALIINNWSHRVKLSEPGLLLILGLGLVVSAGRLPKFLNSRAYGKRRPVSSSEEQRNLKLVGKKSLSLKAVS
jgi:hypothetical protein